MLPTKNITLNMDMLCQQDTYKVNLTPDTRVSSDFGQSGILLD